MDEIKELTGKETGKIFQITICYPRMPARGAEVCFLKVLDNGWVEYQYSSGTVCTHLIKDDGWPIQVDKLHPDIYSDERDSYPTLREPRIVTSIIEITEQGQDFPDCKLISGTQGDERK